jgi:DNA-binding transcriptional MerR regulator
MSKQTQISLDFGPEEHPPASTGDNGTGNDPARHYMAAGGVGVRVKSYKQTPAPAGADLFADTAAKPEQAVPVEVSSERVARYEPTTIQAAAVMPEPPAEEPPTEEPQREEPPTELILTEEPQTEEPQTEKLTAKEPLAAIPASESEPSAADPGKARKPALIPSQSDIAPEDAPLPKRQVSAKATGARQKSLSPQPPSKRGRKSLKQVSAEADLIEIPVDEVLFRKQYYTMGEVSEMFRVNQSLLRFWESEFAVLQPRKNKKGDRYFRPVDIKNLHLIYHLLRQKKYTIEGAKEFLKNNKKADERFEVVKRLQEIKTFLLEMKAQL